MLSEYNIQFSKSPPEGTREEIKERENNQKMKNILSLQEICYQVLDIRNLDIRFWKNLMLESTSRV